ncbi:MAG: oligoendopeptidase F [Candidatus Zixiibacteriota bacterium]
MKSVSSHGKWVSLIVAALFAFSFASAFAQDSGLPQRQDIEEKYKWRVEDIYETIADWDADYAFLENRIGELEKFKGHLGDSPELLLHCLKLSDTLDVVISNMYVFAYLKLDEDNSQSIYQELGGRVTGLNARMGQVQSYIRPEIIALGEEKVKSMVAANDGLKEYEFYFEDMFRQQKHILSPEEERILALAGPLVRAPIDIFQMIDNADHKLGTVADSDGNPMALTYGRYLQILKGRDREARRIANDTVQVGWKKYINTLATTLGAHVNGSWFVTQARGYNSTLERSLDGNNIPTSVFHNLIDAVNANLEPLHKWTSLRKKLMGYDTLYTYDLSVPLTKASDRRYEYNEAIKMILEGLKPLGKDYVKDAKAGFEGGWVDVYENEGKATGAYSWGTYTSHPYILMNYSGDISDVFTLAHEMGHALNRHYTNQAEPYVYHGHTIFTAEVASTCNEAILMKYMLAHAKSKEEKIALLDYYIEQIQGTFFTQVMFSEFEDKINKQIEDGGAVSVDYFRSIYRDIFQKYNGPDLFIGPENDMGGMKIYHFYRTFYVYQYATCYTAAQMISQKILDGDKEALAKYMEFLRTGTSDYPVEILKQAGVDMNSPKPVNYTLKLFGELVDEMEKLLTE